jgi:cell division protein FtsZ
MDFIIDSALKHSEEQEPKELEIGQANIKVIGIGGAGNNMVGWLYQKGIKGAEIIAANTDQQHLNITDADRKFLVGKEVTRGLGCGGFPEKGAEAAQESIQEVKEVLKASDMVFVCAGMGGGTGTGGAPIIAQVAKDTGSIVIGTVTMPFKIERARVDKAEFGLQQLRQVADTVIVIDNNRLVNIAGNLPIKQAFAVANELIATMIKGIVETIAIPSLVNLDYADVKTIMTKSYKGATGALIHIAGGPDMTLDEINKVGEQVTESLDPDANVIWGARVDDDLKGKLTVMTIITGVKSPWILGKIDHTHPSPQALQISEELGIDVVR